VDIPPTVTPTAIPIDVAGPPMVVGSKFVYVDGSVLVAVPGGEFIMGYGGFDNPEHKVSVSDFWIYRTKVTNQQFAACVASGECMPPNIKQNEAYANPKRANDPVVGVNWDQAQAYCNYVHGRLPTEAEWEKAARGPDGNIWPWGDSGPACDMLNFHFCVGKTTNVTEYPDGMSYYEALDMAGNAFEWVADWYSAKYYAQSPDSDPLGPELGQKRSVRGSSFESSADQTISAARYSLKPIESNKDLGFRCVVLDPTYFAPACTQLAVYGKDAVTISGAPEGQTLDNGCPLVSIVQGQTCGPNNTPYTVVTFDPPPPDGNINAGSCAPTGDASKFVCTSEETVSISAACYVETSGGGTCSAGYSFDPATNLCKYSSTGTSGACLAGATYDSSLKCCSAATGGNASSSYPLCPVGTYYDATLNACFDIPVSGAVSSSAVVALKNCTPGSNQPGCDPAVDPSCQGGPCPNGGTYTCVPNPNCPTRCPQICSCR
jgi:formylglycine-generating enzyme required for sulfatase activity